MSSPGAALLERLGLVPTPQFCTAHGSAPYLPLVCTTCISGKRLCASCIIEHSVEHPTHALLPPPALDVTSLRARITQAPQAVVEGCFAVSNNAAAVGGGPAGGAAASYDAPSTTPLVACARHKVAAFAAELELLEERAEAALARIQEDRETAHALVEATFKVRADELEMAVASKRSALQAELVVAQGSLDQATHATEVLIEVS